MKSKYLTRLPKGPKDPLGLPNLAKWGKKAHLLILGSMDTARLATAVAI